MSLILTNYTAADNLLRTGIDLGVLMEGLDGHWQNYLMPALAGGFRTTLPIDGVPGACTYAGGRTWEHQLARGSV